MRLCRYGRAGYEKPGMVDADGRVRDLSKIVDGVGPNEISPRGLKMLTKLKAESLPLVNAAPRFGVPYVGIGKVVAIGLNFTEVGTSKRASATLYDRGHSATAGLKPGDVNWNKLFKEEGVRWLHTGGIFTALGAG